MDLQKNKNGVGLGLRHCHFEEFSNNKPNLNWIEVHPENFLTLGADYEKLQQLKQGYKLSYHGVGMSLGSEWDEESAKHLERLIKLNEYLKCDAFSEHISWSKHQGMHTHDLLPILYDDESLNLISDNIKRMQDGLGMQIAMENPSIYVDLPHKYSEPDFINKLLNKTGCKLLLDVNNIEVSAFNLGYDINEYLDQIDFSNINELHIAGHTTRTNADNTTVKIDTHNSIASIDAWAALEQVIKHPNFDGFAIYEWDTQMPNLQTLLDQTNKIQQIYVQNDKRKAKLSA